MRNPLRRSRKKIFLGGEGMRLLWKLFPQAAFFEVYVPKREGESAPELPLILESTEARLVEPYTKMFYRLFTARDEPLKRILIINVNCEPAVSRRVAANLAITLASEDVATCLVDLDVMEAGLQDVFHQPLAPGVVEYLLKGAKVGEIVRETAIPELKFIPAGRKIADLDEILSLLGWGETLDRLVPRDVVGLVYAGSGKSFDLGELMPEIDGTLLLFSSGARIDRWVRKELRKVRKRSEVVGVVWTNPMDFPLRPSGGAHSASPLRAFAPRETGEGVPVGERRTAALGREAETGAHGPGRPGIEPRDRDATEVGGRREEDGEASGDADDARTSMEVRATDRPEGGAGRDEPAGGEVDGGEDRPGAVDADLEAGPAPGPVPWEPDPRGTGEAGSSGPETGADGWRDGDLEPSGDTIPGAPGDGWSPGEERGGGIGAGGEGVGGDALPDVADPDAPTEIDDPREDLPPGGAGTGAVPGRTGGRVLFTSVEPGRKKGPAWLALFGVILVALLAWTFLEWRGAIDQGAGPGPEAGPPSAALEAPRGGPGVPEDGTPVAGAPAETPPGGPTVGTSGAGAPPAGEPSGGGRAEGVRGYPVSGGSVLPYSLVFGSFRDPESAAKGRDALRRAGFDAYLVPVELGDLGRWTRVMVGHFRDEAEARARLEAIVAGSDAPEGRVVNASWAYLMGMYASVEDADSARAGIEAAGLDPYLLRHLAEERMIAVYVGAFESEGQAGPLGERLRTLGLDGELVRRSGAGL